MTPEFREALTELAAVMEKHSLSFDIRIRQEQWNDVNEGIDITQSFKENHWPYSYIELPDNLEHKDVSRPTIHSQPTTTEHVS